MNRDRSEPRPWQFTLRDALLAIGFGCLALGAARHGLADASVARFLLTAMLLVAALSSSCALIVGLPFLLVCALAGAIPKSERREWWTIATMTATYTVTFWLVLFYA